MFSWSLITKRQRRPHEPQTTRGTTPYDILFQISSYLQPVGQPYIDFASIKAMLAFCLVCKDWLEAGTDTLYSHARLATNSSCETFAKTLQTRPSLGDKVRYLQFPDIPLPGQCVLRRVQPGLEPILCLPWGSKYHEMFLLDAPRSAVALIMTRCRRLRAIAASTHSLMSGERFFQLSAEYSKPSSSLTRIHLRGAGVDHRVPFQDLLEVLAFFEHNPIEELSLSHYWCDPTQAHPKLSSLPKPFPRLHRLCVSVCAFHLDGWRLLLLGLGAPITSLEIRNDDYTIAVLPALKIAEALPLEHLTVMDSRFVEVRAFQLLRSLELQGPQNLNIARASISPPPNILLLKLEYMVAPRGSLGKIPFLWVRDLAKILRSFFLPQCRQLRRVEVRVHTVSVQNWRVAADCLALLFPNLDIRVEVQLVRHRAVKPPTYMERVANAFRIQS